MGRPRWVREGLLARSSRPGYPEPHVEFDVVDQWLEQVRDMGIRSVICLLSFEQLRHYPSVPHGLLDHYRAAGLTVRHFAITDPAHDERGYQELCDSLPAILAAYEELPKPVVIHCNAGLSRTGGAVFHILKHEARREP